MSTLPPGVLGTMIRIGFVGYVCAMHGGANNIVAAASAAAVRSRAHCHKPGG
jgi:hypothetical protein